MTTNDNFERTLAAWLRADADRPYPDPLDAVIARTSTSRQQPWWSSPERWLPVDTTFRPRFFQTPRPSQVLLLGAVILALVGALLLYAGSQQHRLPPPFGPARNGALLSSADGDIYAIDPETSKRTVVIGGSTFDFGASFSRDGTKFMFLRGAPTDCGRADCGLIMMVASADGTDVRELTPGLPGLDWQDWSPDGKQIAFDSADPSGRGHVLQIVNVDGSELRTLPAGRPVHELSWLPPDGKQIVFRGEQLSASDPAPGIFAIRPDGTGLREISTRPAVDANDYSAIGVSPDGQYVTYQDTNFDANPPWGLFQVHVLSLRTGEDRVLPQPAGTAQMGATFSPDGQKVAYLRIDSASQIRIVVAPVDGGTTGVAIGPAEPFRQDGENINNYSWSPDGTAILANYDADKTARLVPIDGSPPIELTHGDLALPGYQRLAP